MTPEGKVKMWVDQTLQSFATHKPCWWFKPVQFGRGKPALDYIGCCNGKFFTVETKSPGEWLTPFQRLTAKEMHESGAAVFIVSSIEGVRALGAWLKRA